MTIFSISKNKRISETDKCDSAVKAGDILVRLTAVLFWTMVWWGCSVAVGKEILLPSPWLVLRRLCELAGTREFWLSCGGSLLRVIAGFALAFVCGIAMGVLMRLSPLLRRLLEPLLAVVKATPVASFIILALVWIKSTMTPVFIAFLIVLPVITSNVDEGIAQTDARLIEMCDIFGIRGIKRLRALYIPSLAPYLLAAVRTGLGLAWKSGVAAEVIGRTRGSIGDMLYQSKLYLETADLFAWTAAVVVLSRGLELAVVAAGQRFQRQKISPAFFKGRRGSWGAAPTKSLAAASETPQPNQ